MNYDTIRLLKACDLGCKYACSGMDSVLPFVKNKELKSYIESKNFKHVSIGESCEELLREQGKLSPTPAALSLLCSRIKADIKLCFAPNSRTVATLMIDGCKTGISEMCGALKKCPSADKESVELVKSVIKEQQEFIEEMIEYY